MRSSHWLAYQAGDGGQFYGITSGHVLELEATLTSLFCIHTHTDSAVGLIPVHRVYGQEAGPDRLSSSFGQ